MRGKLQIAVAAAMLSTAVSAAPFDFDAAFRRVESAVAGRHPKTAARELALLEKEAVALHRWDVAVRCAFRRMDVSRKLENVPCADLLSVYSAFADAAPEPMQPALRAILAHRYWEAYCESHPLAGPRNTLLEDDEGDDPARWSPEHAVAFVRGRLDTALASADEWKRIPASVYADLFSPVPDGDAVLPNLFDRLALDAISFDRLFLEEKPLDAEGYALAPASVFCAHPPEKDRDGSAFRAIRLYRELLAFHEHDKDRRAFEEIDFSRLQFCYAACRAGDARERRYADALEQFATRARRYEVASRAAALRAQLAVREGNPGLAHLIASRGAAAHPDTPGGKRCAELVWELEQPSLSLETDRVWGGPRAEIKVRYRNLREAVFTLYPVSFDQVRSVADGAATWGRLLSGGFGEKTAKAWTQPLPPSPDYQERDFSFAAPKDLPKGLYALLVSPGHPFNGREAPVLGEWICVSDIAILVAPSLPSGEQRGCVLRVRDGTPVDDAEVEVWKREAAARASAKIAVLKTAANGMFSFKGVAGRYLFRADSPAGTAVTWSPVSVTRGDKKKKKVERLSIFTDRAAYKPGHPIYVTGVVSCEEGRECRPVANRSVEVSLSGPDAGLTSATNLVTDSLGTFRCAFEAPQTGKDAVLRIAAGKRAERRVRLYAGESRRPVSVPEEETIEDEVKRFKEGRRWRAALTVPRWLPAGEPVPFRLSVTSDAGKPVAARGTLKLFAVRNPSAVQPPEPGETDDGLFRDWKDAEELATQTVAASADGAASGSVSLKPGVYRFRFETTDPARNRVTNETAFCVFDPAASRFTVPVSDFLVFSDDAVRPGRPLRVFWGTGYGDGRCLFSVYDGKTLLYERWSREGATQDALTIPMGETIRGPLVVNTSFLRGNRFYSRSRTFLVERPDAGLNLSLTRFNERPLPGGEENWAFSVTDASGRPQAAEIVAFLVSGEETAPPASYLDDLPSRRAAAAPWKWQGGRVPVPLRRGSFHAFQELPMDAFRVEVWSGTLALPWKRPFLFFRHARPRRSSAPDGRLRQTPGGRKAERLEGSLTEASPEARVYALPALSCGEGEAAFTFTAPDEPGRWRLLAFAHDASFRTARCDVPGIETIKPLALSLNPPAFLREGDKASCSGVVQNHTGESRNVRFFCKVGGEGGIEKPASDPEPLPPDGARQFPVVFSPDTAGALAYRAAAECGTNRDVAEGAVPVLPARGWAEASFLVAVRGGEERKIEFNPLLVADESDTLRSRELTVCVFATPRAAARQALERLAEADRGEGDAVSLAAQVFARTVLGTAETDGDEDAWRTLAKCRTSGGMWTWFPDGEGNEDVTQDVFGILARLRRLTGPETALPDRAAKLLEETDDVWRKEAKSDWANPSPSLTARLYLATLLRGKHKKVQIRKAEVDAASKTLREGWMELDRLAQARAALVLLRSGDTASARKIGAYSRNRLDGSSRRPERTPYLVTALAAELELFRELRDAPAEEAASERLLALKDGAGWGDPAATVAAVYALLFPGAADVGNVAQVEVHAGGKPVEWTSATNGMKSCVFFADAAASSLGLLDIHNASQNTCWLELHWRYTEDARKVSAGDGTLTVRRRYFIRPSAADGGTLIPFRGEAEKGMELVTRIELENERPRSRLCIVEGRPACLRPRRAGNGWRMRKGVRYYETSGEAEDRFYIENLPKGTFTIETSGRISEQGEFHGGELHVDGIRLPGVPFRIRR